MKKSLNFKSIISNYFFTQNKLGAKMVKKWFYTPCLVLCFILPTTQAREIKVMTRNVYVGFDVLKITKATHVHYVPKIVMESFNDVKATNFHARAMALAKEIRDHLPDLVGLQEVALFRQQTPGDSLKGNPIDAMDVTLDYLEILMNSLKKQGVKYQIVSTQVTADIEAPMFVGKRLARRTVNPLDDLRLTNRDVILKKIDKDIDIHDVHQDLFTNQLEFNFLDSDWVIPRGYILVTASIRNQDYIFVNTHLETQTDNDWSLMIQALQASELVEILNQKDGLPIVLLGDFNSDPEDSSQPYHILKKAGFTDTWNNQTPSPITVSIEGNTCCYGALLNDPTQVLGQRIDHIWTKLPNGTFMDQSMLTLLGNHNSDMVEGLWPSDHAGLFGFFQFYWKP